MTFKEDLSQQTVARLPLRNAIAIGEHTILRAAIAIMRAHSLGCAVIVDHQLRPRGIFTEQSIIKMLMEERSLDSTPVSEFADPNYYLATLDDPIAKVWDAVIEGARFVCVTDNSDQLVGLTGQRGLAEYVCDCYASQIAVQRLGSAPWMLQREGA